MTHPVHYHYHHYDAPSSDANTSPNIWSMILVFTIAAFLAKLYDWVFNQCQTDGRAQQRPQLPERIYAPSDDEVCQLSDDASDTSDTEKFPLGPRQVRPPNQSSRRPPSHPYLPPQGYVVSYSTGNPPTFRRFSQTISAKQIEAKEWTVTIAIDTIVIAEEHSWNQHLRVLDEAVNWSVDQAESTVELQIQVAAEPHWDSHLRRETLKFIEKVLALDISHMQIKGMAIDVQALPEPRGPRYIQNGTTFSLPILESFKFSGNLYFDPSQHWHGLWNLPFRSLKTLCLDNLGESGLHVHDCIAILDICNSSVLEKFSVSPLVTGGARQPLLLAMTRKEMVSLTSLSISSSDDIRILLQCISFPRLEDISLRLGNPDSMSAFVDSIDWTFIRSSELYGIVNDGQSRQILTQLGHCEYGTHRHLTLRGEVLFPKSHQGSEYCT